MDVISDAEIAALDDAQLCIVLRFVRDFEGTVFNTDVYFQHAVSRLISSFAHRGSFFFIQRRLAIVMACVVADQLRGRASIVEIAS